jgi:hypothetical protein
LAHVADLPDDGNPEVIPADPIRAITSGWPTIHPEPFFGFFTILVNSNSTSQGGTDHLASQLDCAAGAAH